jgi:hypothetical protein
VKTYVVTRFVPEGEHHNCSGRDVQEGETLYQCTRPTYGSVDTRGGIAVSEQPGQYPFFEFPADAVEVAGSTAGEVA